MKIEANSLAQQKRYSGKVRDKFLFYLLTFSQIVSYLSEYFKYTSQSFRYPFVYYLWTAEFAFILVYPG